MYKTSYTLEEDKNQLKGAKAGMKALQAKMKKDSFEATKILAKLSPE